MRLKGNITTMIHGFIDERVEEGQVWVDGTVGNGHDTLYLAKKVGSNGKVYGFDIQQMAIDATTKSLTEESVKERVELLKTSHAEVLTYVKEPIQGAVFNLGYLPKSDKNIITTSHSTIKAIQGCLSLLERGGSILITSYYGHLGGVEEKNAVVEYLSDLDQKAYTVLKMDFLNRQHNPPIIFLLEKR